MAATNAPSLSSWLTESGKKLDELMTNFAISDYSQSFCYYGHISSLSYLVGVNQHSPDRLQQLTTTMLHNYLGRFYDEVRDLKVTVKYISKETERVDLAVAGYVVENKTSYDLEGLLRTESGKFIKWMKEQNDGLPND